MEIDIRTAAMAGGAALVASLAAGKGIRRLLLLPFEWAAGKWKNRTASVILDEVEKDLGITNTLEEADHVTEEKK